MHGVHTHARARSHPYTHTQEHFQCGCRISEGFCYFFCGGIVCFWLWLVKHNRCCKRWIFLWVLIIYTIPLHCPSLQFRCICVVLGWILILLKWFLFFVFENDSGETLSIVGLSCSAGSNLWPGISGLVLKVDGCSFD